LKNSGRGYFGPEGDEQAVGPTADADVEQLSGKETDRGRSDDSSVENEGEDAVPQSNKQASCQTIDHSQPQGSGENAVPGASVTVDRRKRRRRRGQDEGRISTIRWNENVCDTPNTKNYAKRGKTEQDFSFCS
jgi:hypothetical protein